MTFEQAGTYIELILADQCDARETQAKLTAHELAEALLPFFEATFKAMGRFR